MILLILIICVIIACLILEALLWRREYNAVIDVQELLEKELATRQLN